jgi:NTP pyrophosphatase (non-canonical NTP hydrolase)
MTPEEIDAMSILLAHKACMDQIVAHNLITGVLEKVQPIPRKAQPVIYYDTLEEANIARQLEWKNSDKLDLSYYGNAAAGEMGEACNVIKKLERERLGLDGSRASVRDLATELGDVMVYVSLIAIKSGINLDRATAEKFNETSRKLGFKTRLKQCP